MIIGFPSFYPLYPPVTAFNHSPFPPSSLPLIPYTSYIQCLNEHLYYPAPSTEHLCLPDVMSRTTSLPRVNESRLLKQAAHSLRASYRRSFPSSDEHETDSQIPGSAIQAYPACCRVRYPQGIRWTQHPNCPTWCRRIPSPRERQERPTSFQGLGRREER